MYFILPSGSLLSPSPYVVPEQIWGMCLPSIILLIHHLPKALKLALPSVWIQAKAINQSAFLSVVWNFSWFFPFQMEEGDLIYLLAGFWCSPPKKVSQGPFSQIQAWPNSIQKLSHCRHFSKGWHCLWAEPTVKDNAGLGWGWVEVTFSNEKLEADALLLILAPLPPSLHSLRNLTVLKSFLCPLSQFSGKGSLQVSWWVLPSGSTEMSEKREQSVGL